MQKLPLKLARDEARAWSHVLTNLVTAYDLPHLRTSPGEYALMTVLYGYRQRVHARVEALWISRKPALTLDMKQAEALAFFYFTAGQQMQRARVEHLPGTYEYNLVQSIRDAIHQTYLA